MKKLIDVSPIWIDNEVIGIQCPDCKYNIVVVGTDKDNTYKCSKCGKKFIMEQTINVYEITEDLTSIEGIILKIMDDEFPNNKIKLMNISYDSDSFSPKRFIMINGIKTNIELSPDYVQDITSCYSPSQREVLNPIIEKIKEYLEKIK